MVVKHCNENLNSIRDILLLKPNLDLFESLTRVNLFLQKSNENWFATAVLPGVQVS